MSHRYAGSEDSEIIPEDIAQDRRGHQEDLVDADDVEQVSSEEIETITAAQKAFVKEKGNRKTTNAQACTKENDDATVDRLNDALTIDLSELWLHYRDRLTKWLLFTSPIVWADVKTLLSL